MKEEEIVQVKKSQLPEAGQGLYAIQVIEKKQFICEYKGSKLKYPPLNETHLDYIVYCERDLYVDATDYLDSLGRYANDLLPQDKKQFPYLRINARFCYNNRTKTMKLMAIRNIEKGEEIFVSYGPAYWRRKKTAAKKKQ